MDSKIANTRGRLRGVAAQEFHSLRRFFYITTQRKIEYEEKARENSGYGCSFFRCLDCFCSAVASCGVFISITGKRIRYSSPKFETVALLARELNISLDAIVFEDSAASVSKSVADFFYGKSEAEIQKYILLCQQADAFKAEK